MSEKYNSNTNIVTCLYNFSPYSRIGGRGYGWEHYLAPFYNLTLLDANIILYTDEVLAKKAENFFESIKFKNYKIIVYDITEYRHSDLIFKIKEKEGTIDKKGLVEGLPYIRNDRNHHICLSKIVLILDSLKENYFNSETTFWIDGGLFHHGLIPESLGGMERLTVPDMKRLWPQNKNSVCNPTFFTKLIKKAEKDLVLLGIENYYGRPEHFNKVFKEKKIAHIVGGLFGGKNQTLKYFCEEFEKAVDCLFDNNILSLEEEVLSGVFADRFSDQGYLAFTHWSHDRPEEPNYLEAPPGSDSFYKLFL